MDFGTDLGIAFGMGWECALERTLKRTRDSWWRNGFKTECGTGLGTCLEWTLELTLKRTLTWIGDGCLVAYRTWNGFGPNFGTDLGMVFATDLPRMDTCVMALTRHYAFSMHAVHVDYHSGVMRVLRGRYLHRDETIRDLCGEHIRVGVFR